MVMNEMPWFQSFLQTNKDQIIENWLNRVEQELPGRYHTSILRNNGLAYFQMLTELDIPEGEHSSFEFIPMLCKYHAQQQTPLTYLLHSSHMWREAILDCIEKHSMETDLSGADILSASREIHRRIDKIQQMICESYSDYSKHLLEERDQTIHELHKDRLSLLGKMAASMVHELRNPLFAIEGFLKMIRGTLSPEGLASVETYLDIIQHEFNGLYGHISGFLSFSKNNEVEEVTVICTTQDIIDNVMRLIHPRLLNEQVDIQVEINSESLIEAQKTAIQQVLFNLISNSIEALEHAAYPKRITVNSYEDETHLWLFVADNGTGIPAELQDRLFDPFVSSKKSGTGLGLAICKQIIEKNHGKIELVPSQTGAIFRLSLPKALPDERTGEQTDWRSTEQAGQPSEPSTVKEEPGRTTV
ncbi:sensor histidine kinase [Brevibacillus dissolubilis]|uniref:sensor histidine kinase n=1 Tax=Brevibacillus dissolubilis TaxID=1844116 RepID=UPI00159B98A9|nr:HAMP domain-containing sensor histidine kinase [Brevibacillus dissolubilis]